MLKTAFDKDAHIWRNLFSLLKLIRQGDNRLKSDKLDYGTFVLEKRYLSLDEGFSFLQRLEEGELNIRGYTPCSIEIDGVPEFRGSGELYGYLRADWPTRRYKYRVKEGSSYSIDREALVSLDYPLFRDGNEALKTFFDLEVTTPYFTFENIGAFWVLIPDYRARLRQIKITHTKVLAVIDAEYFDEKDLRIRMFAKKGVESFTSPLLKLKQHHAEFDCKQDLDYILVYLLSIFRRKLPKHNKLHFLSSLPFLLGTCIAPHIGAQM